MAAGTGLKDTAEQVHNASTGPCSPARTKDWTFIQEAAGATGSIRCGRERSIWQCGPHWEGQAGGREAGEEALHQPSLFASIPAESIPPLGHGTGHVCFRYAVCSLCREHPLTLTYLCLLPTPRFHVAPTSTKPQLWPRLAHLLLNPKVQVCPTHPGDEPHTISLCPAWASLTKMLPTVFPSSPL